MTYVVIGLALLFGAFAIIGVNSVRQATELVHTQQLSTAYATAAILNRDFLQISHDVSVAMQGTSANDSEQLETVAGSLVEQLSKTDPFPFFQVTGVWIISPEGGLLAQVGTPRLASDRDSAAAAAALSGAKSQFIVIPEPAVMPEGVPFATIIAHAGEGAQAGQIVVVHTISTNSPNPYVPASYGSQHDAPSKQAAAAQDTFHLEVLRPDGTVVLGIGPDEWPGVMSVHFDIVRGLMSAGKAGTVLHTPGPGDKFQAHSIAAVPLTKSGFYLILEQPVDLAMAVPRRLENEMIAAAAIGALVFGTAAWVAARAVANPIRRLRSATQAIAGGDLEDPVGVKAQDEVGELAEEIEAMRQQLKADRDKLAQANARLEQDVADRTQRLRETLGKLITAQEEERRRLARDLHDGQSQALSALSTSFDRLNRLLTTLSPEEREELVRARFTASRLLDDTRRLIYDLRPSLLDEIGLEAAIRWSARTHLEQNGIAVSIQSSLSPARLPSHIEVAFFRIAQEAIANIERHSRAKHAGVTLGRLGPVVRMKVWDDGRGIDAANSGTESSGIGLESIRERVHLIGGNLEIQSEPGKGTSIIVEASVE